METGNTTNGSPLITVKQVAALLSVSERHIHRMRDLGRIPPPIRVGRLLRWDRSKLDAWIDAGCPPVRKGVA